MKHYRGLLCSILVPVTLKLLHRLPLKGGSGELSLRITSRWRLLAAFAFSQSRRPEENPPLTMAVRAAGSRHLAYDTSVGSRFKTGTLRSGCGQRGPLDRNKTLETAHAVTTLRPERG